MNNHFFKISVARLQNGEKKELTGEDWCLKCWNFHWKAIEKIQNKGYELLSNINQISDIRVKCQQGHIFKLNSDLEFLLDLNQICEICSVNFEIQRREYLKQKAIQDEKEAKQKQRELFENYQRQQQQEQMMNNDAQIAIICTQAKSQTEILLQKYPQFTQQEIYNVIKIMMMPI